jgi:hypothetical protein
VQPRAQLIGQKKDPNCALDCVHLASCFWFDSCTRKYIWFDLILRADDVPRTARVVDCVLPVTFSVLALSWGAKPAQLARIITRNQDTLYGIEIVDAGTVPVHIVFWDHTKVITTNTTSRSQKVGLQAMSAATQTWVAVFMLVCMLMNLRLQSSLSATSL